MPLIFAVLFCTAFALFITGSVKKMELMEKVSLGFCIPLEASIADSILFLKLPDSHHVLIISFFAVIFTEALLILTLLKPFKNQIIEKLLFLVSTTFWISIFNSIFYIYRCHIVINILFTVIWIAFFLFFVLKSRLKDIKKIAEFFLVTCFSISLFYICFVSVLYEHSLDSLFCFIGSAALVIYCGFDLWNSIKAKPVYSILKKLLLVFGTFFILAGTVLLQF